MKKVLESDFAQTVVAVIVTLSLAELTIAAEKKDARVTQVIRDVRLLTSRAAARTIAVNESVHEGTAVKTGSDSRAELTFTDLTLTRLGANTVFSFGESAREFDLANGALLICAPKNKGEFKINTVGASAAVTGGIAMTETHSKSWTKFIVIEGEACVKLKGSGEPCMKLHPGEMLVLPPGAKRFTEKRNVNLRKLTKTAGLIHQAPLPGWVEVLISAEINHQEASPPAGGYTDPTGLDKTDQKAATVPTPRPPPVRPEPSPDLRSDR
jgi:mannose-6-phosphate isomerase-like protein (cupin superfamily)